ncbi:peptidoglycan DD-metalloendopeptidase family protein [Flavobacteriaceae bacterium]|jgi:septal ring factor EnvC (AmiA/AmiB activator)|nr:peptidoglycan DD-metalloendopeptidase family protein [Flavobacteriaceae bacterium]
MKKSFYFLIFFVLGFVIIQAQQNSKKQKELEVQRLRLKKEIKKINSILFNNIKIRKSALTQVEDLQVKLNVRLELLKVTNEQANLLTTRISINERNISTNRLELRNLKDEYANLIQKSYESKSLQNRLMFLFSSESFLQAYKRVQYLKQYASYRRKQGKAIANKTKLLQELNRILNNEKAEKILLIEENRLVQKQIEKDAQDQKSLIKTLEQKQTSLASQILKKEKQQKAIDREINRLIREAIAASNKALDKKRKKTFQLTPEAKLIADNFKANKGRLPWPLEKGVVVQGFGRQRHPVVKTTTIQSNGVILATEPLAKVRAVFEGEVMSVIVIKGSNPSVLIRHGNFITLYTNLAKLYVTKGEKVNAKQAIGEVFTNLQTGKTQFQFGIFNNVNALNPKEWVYQM